MSVIDTPDRYKIHVCAIDTNMLSEPEIHIFKTCFWMQLVWADDLRTAGYILGRHLKCQIMKMTTEVTDFTLKFT